MKMRGILCIFLDTLSRVCCFFIFKDLYTNQNIGSKCINHFITWRLYQNVFTCVLAFVDLLQNDEILLAFFAFFSNFVKVYAEIHAK